MSEQDPTGAKHRERRTQNILELIKINLELEADNERLDALLSWHGINWLIEWAQVNTSPPTRGDIDNHIRRILNKDPES